MMVVVVMKIITFFLEIGLSNTRNNYWIIGETSRRLRLSNTFHVCYAVEQNSSEWPVLRGCRSLHVERAPSFAVFDRVVCT